MRKVRYLFVYMHESNKGIRKKEPKIYWHAKVEN